MIRVGNYVGGYSSNEIGYQKLDKGELNNLESYRQILEMRTMIGYKGALEAVRWRIDQINLTQVKP